MIIKTLKNLMVGLRTEKGQGMVEYAILLCFMALAIILALGELRSGLSDFFSTVATRLE